MLTGDCFVVPPRNDVLDFISMLDNQLKDCRNSSGDKLVLVLNSLLNDCGCSKPSW
jgi:hypothetical protein